MYRNLKWTMLSALVGLCWSQDPVKVAVYYETLCPDSVNFIEKQLWPAYEKVLDVFTVKFYPYGFETVTQNGNSYEFKCQHGSKECYGNSIHSCALKYYPNNVDNVPFIGCSIGDYNPPEKSQNCAVKYNLNWTTINACAKGEEGRQLLYQNGAITKEASPPITWVPWIIINDSYSAENKLEATKNLLKLICDTYTGTQPCSAV